MGVSRGWRARWAGKEVTFIVWLAHSKDSPWLQGRCFEAQREAPPTLLPQLGDRETQPHRERDNHTDKKAWKRKLRSIPDATGATTDSQEQCSATSTEMPARDRGKHPETARVSEPCTDLERQARDQGSTDQKGHSLLDMEEWRQCYWEREPATHIWKSLPWPQAVGQRAGEVGYRPSRLSDRETPDGQQPHGSEIRASESWLQRGCCGEDVPSLCMPGRCPAQGGKYRSVPTCPGPFSGGIREDGDAHEHGVPGHLPICLLEFGLQGTDSLAGYTSSSLCSLLLLWPVYKSAPLREREWVGSGIFKRCHHRYTR